MNITNIFLYQAEAPIVEAITAYLEQYGYSVDFYSCESYDRALLALESEFYDLCVIGLSQDQENRFSLVDKAREFDVNVPVILLHDDTHTDFIIKAYKEHNVDVCMAKPISISVLEAQIEALIRRSSSERAKIETIYTIGKYKADIAERKLILGDSLINLTEREADILGYLCMFMNKEVSTDELLDATYGKVAYTSRNNMQYYLVRLRRYLSADPRIKIESKYANKIGLYVTLV